MPSVGKRRKKGMLAKLSFPKPRIGRRQPVSKALGTTAKALGDTATEVGKASYRLGELTSEVRRTREQASKES